MTDDRKSGAARARRIMAMTAGISLLLMALWGATVVRPWAQRSNGYSTPGAFGDSFAPVVGLLSSLALGAAIASVLMQREELQLQRREMELAREQWTSQAKAQQDANKLAEYANDLARSAQALEALRQVRDLEAQAAEVIRTIPDRGEPALAKIKADAAMVWLAYAGSSPKARIKEHGLIDCYELKELAGQRDMLVFFRFQMLEGHPAVFPRPGAKSEGTTERT